MDSTIIGEYLSLYGNKQMGKDIKKLNKCLNKIDFINFIKERTNNEDYKEIGGSKTLSKVFNSLVEKYIQIGHRDDICSINGKKLNQILKFQ
tara:strand:- start:506 stop:781 length:276 start_codon:yes stop_codon:yes gene_type:complete